MKIKGKIWLENDDESLLNERIFHLLQAIDRHNSLRDAARETGMSYSFAWNCIYRLNCRLPNPIVAIQRGGKGGGYANLTKHGIDLVRKYKNLLRHFENFIASQSNSLIA